MEVGPLSCEGYPSIQTITVWPSLFPPCFTCHLMEEPYGSSTPCGEDDRLTVFLRSKQNGLGSFFPPVVLLSTVRETFSPNTNHATFLVQAYQHPLACSAITAFIKDSLTLAIPFTLALFHLMLTEPPLPHGFSGFRYVVRRLGTVCYLTALLPSVQLVE